MAIGISTYHGIGYYKTIDLDAPIYRFISLARLLEALDKNELYLRNTLFWEDNWEIPTRFFNDIGLSEEGAQFINKNSMYPTYAICLTKTYDTDAMWRIYSKDSGSVCIETTTRQLLLELRQHSDYISAYIAPVIYCEISKDNPTSVFNKEIADQYPGMFYVPFLKRGAFSHENELRLAVQLVSTRHNTDKSETGLKLAYDYKKIINRIILDPRLSTLEVNYHKKGLDFLGVPVEQSLLYSTGLFNASDYSDLIQNVCMSSNSGSMFGSFSLALEEEKK